MDSLTSLFIKDNYASLNTAFKRNISVFEHWTSEYYKKMFQACTYVPHDSNTCHDSLTTVAFCLQSLCSTNHKYVRSDS